jgi:hypothetical protein
LEGDAEANYAYYALHKLHIRVKDFINMDKYEKAATIAMIDLRIEKEKKEAKELKSKARVRKRK